MLRLREQLHVPHFVSGVNSVSADKIIFREEFRLQANDETSHRSVEPLRVFNTTVSHADFYKHINNLVASTDQKVRVPKDFWGDENCAARGTRNYPKSTFHSLGG